jgi:sodium/potassium-transporting ATPase subunit alpha
MLVAGLGGLLILSIDLLTEQGPAISLAYEPAEARVMERPPRDMTRDRLINGPLLRYSYLIVGVVEVNGRLFFLIAQLCGQQDHCRQLMCSAYS